MKMFSALFIVLFSMAVWAGDPVWIDVRSAGEFSGGHIEGAHNIPHNEIVAGVKALKLDKDAEVLLYCRSGRRATFALEQLQQQGYTNVKNIGGFEDAQRYGGPL